MRGCGLIGIGLLCFTSCNPESSWMAAVSPVNEPRPGAGRVFTSMHSAEPVPAKSDNGPAFRPAHGEVGEPDPVPHVEVTANGVVFPNPLYPYVGHGYYGDIEPGDNDLPWLRQFAADEGVFAEVDLTLDWKEREWEMIQAIIRYTARTLAWTDVSTRRPAKWCARLVLEDAATSRDLTWACGDIAVAAQGLAQAHGIPCRLVNGRAAYDPWSGDFCCEMYSTRFNRWVFVMPHCNAWIEHATDGPLGMRELHDYDSAGLIRTRNVNGECHAVPVHPLQFMPTRRCRAPKAPHYTARWWAGCFQHFHVGWRSQLHGTVFSNRSVFNDNFLNEYFGFNPPGPVMAIDDLNITYPLNNVQGQAELANDGVHVRLVNNMFEFTGYEYQEEDGPWQPVESAPSRDGVTAFWWAPEYPATLRIRGVNLAGVHSPDVVVEYTWQYPQP